MRITSVQSFLLCYPFPKPIKLTYYGGERTILKRDAMLIRLKTDNGLVGYAPGQGSESAHAAIRDVVAPFLEGRVLADPDALRVQFFDIQAGDPSVQKAYCMVEIAMYDLLGKALGVPVSELLGGRVRDRIRLYGSAGMYQSPEGYAAEAAAIAGLGYKAYKMRPALGPDQDLETVRLMRKAVGPDVELMVDAHSWWRMGDRSYDAETVDRLARELATHEVAWLEEPMPPEDHDAYRRLRDKEYLPIASGEHEPTEERFQDLIMNECVDYVQMDVVCQGGYVTGRHVVAGVARQGLRFAFHSWGTDLEIAAAAHLGICWPEAVVEWLEYPVYSSAAVKSMYEFPLAHEILEDPLAIAGGTLEVSREPGLGVKVNETVIEKYPWIPGPWSYFKLHSPPETYQVTSDHTVKWTA